MQDSTTGESHKEHIAGPAPAIRRTKSAMIPYIAAILASVTSVLGSLCMLVLLMAGLANAKPAQLTQGKWMMWGIVAVQVLSLAITVWLMLRHKPWPASIVGMSPLVCVITLLIVLVAIEW